MKRKKHKSKPKSTLGQIWYFIWEDNSIWSWLVNIVLAFIIIKFLVYPGLGLVLGGTSHPVVAVVSGSMEHKTAGSQGSYSLCNATYTQRHHVDFDEWWETCGYFYDDYNITKNDFLGYPFRNGFNKGDIIVLYGSDPEDMKIGDVTVYKSDMPDPIIHRVVKKWQDDDGLHFQTKGDHNQGSNYNEKDIQKDKLIGKAVFRIPYLGWIKIIFVETLKMIVVIFT